MKKIKLRAKKILSPIINLFIYLSGKFIPLDNNLMLFGCSFGAFKDNTKYLFLYANKQPQIRAYWISPNKSLIKKLRIQGYKAVHTRSIRAFFLIVRARYFFIVSGIQNITDYQIRKDSIVINLWHGTPIKKIMFDSPRDQKLSTAQGGTLERELARWNYFTVGHQNLIPRFSSALKNKNKSYFLPTGQPRNDILFEVFHSEEKKENLKKKVTKEITKKTDHFTITTYCPTHRDSPSKEDIVAIENLLKYFPIYFPEDHHLLFLRLHPIRRQTISSSFFIPNKIYDVSDYEDSQEILASTDHLISDYSSIIYDFLILKKPIFLYLYDIKKYQIERNGFYEEIEELPFPREKNIKDLYHLIKTKKYSEYQKKQNSLSNKYNADEGASKRIMEICPKLVKLPYSSESNLLVK